MEENKPFANDPKTQDPNKQAPDQIQANDPKTGKNTEQLTPDPLSGYQPPPNNPFKNVEKLKSSYTSAEKALAILLISAIVIIVGIGSYVGYKDFENRDKKKIAVVNTETPAASPPAEGQSATQNQQVTTTPPSPTPTTALEETENWALYSDSDNGYSFKYPNSYTFTSYQEGNYLGVAITHIGPTQAASGRTQTELFDGLTLRTLVIDDYSDNVSNYASQERERELANDPQPTVSPINQITVGNKTGYSYTTEGFGKAEVTFVQLNSSILKIVSMYEGSDELKQQYTSRINTILTTFEFAD